METTQIPTLSGSVVKLMPMTKEHMPLLYQWITDIETVMLWINRRDIPTYEQYLEEIQWKLKNNVLTQLIIARASDNVNIGTIYAYDTNTADGFTFVTIYLAPKYTNIGYGTEAARLFVDYLFAYLPIRKIYTEVYGYNQKSLRVMQSAGLIQEGCFKEHRWFNGSYTDLYRFALYRKDWQKIRQNYFAYIEQNNNTNNSKE